ncbi:hypothetical protein PanWU01x14_220130, partial [Parasponia andersonii]
MAFWRGVDALIMVISFGEALVADCKLIKPTSKLIKLTKRGKRKAKRMQMTADPQSDL